MDLFKLVGRFVIDTSNAEAEIDSIVGLLKDAGYTISQTSEQASEAGEQMGKSFGRNSTFGAGSVWLGNTLTKMSSAFFSFGKNLVKTGFAYNAQIEQLTIDFTTMMGGNEEAAQNLVGELQQLAKVTPMETLGLAKTANLLMGYGTAAEDVISTLTMLGDVAGGSQEKLDHIALAYGQAMAAGKLNAQDANQMINAGFPVWTKLAEYLNLSVSDVRKLSEEGGVTADILTGMFQSITSEGGQYYGKMQAQSESYEGQLSTMKDMAAQSSGALMQPFFDVVSSDVFPSLSVLLEEFTTWCIENKDQLTELATAIGNLVVNGLTALLDVFKWVTTNGESLGVTLTVLAGGFTAIQFAINPIKGAFTALILLGTLAAANWNKIKDVWNDITTAIDNAIISLQRFFGINAGSAVKQSVSGVYHGGSNSGGSFESDVPAAVESNADWDGTSAGFWGYPKAKGMDYVPYDEYPAILHKGEAVLKASEAAVWRNGGGMGDTSRLEGMMQQLLGVMNQVVANTGRNQNLVLDSGVLVGQIAPKMDIQLGTFASKKGRGI